MGVGHAGFFVLLRGGSAGMFKKVMLSSLTAFLVLLGYIFWEANRVVVVHDTLAFTDLPAGFDGFRILHITDVHAKTFGENQSRLLAKLKGENVDLIVLTGDYMDRHSGKDQVAPTLDLIKGLRALFPQAPVYFVTGNEDVHDQNDRLVTAMQQAGAIFLEGGHPRHPYALKRGNDRIWIGTASYTEEEFQTFGIEKEDFYIALTHYPWEANIEEKNREAEKRYEEAMTSGADPRQVKKIVYVDADLIFAGHTHGGQIRLPFIGTLYAPADDQKGVEIELVEKESKTKSFIDKLREEGFFPKYSKGIYRENGRVLYISGGLGVGGDFPLLRFRFLNPPEVNLVELKRARELPE